MDCVFGVDCFTARIAEALMCVDRLDVAMTYCDEAMLARCQRSAPCFCASTTLCASPLIATRFVKNADY